MPKNDNNDIFCTCGAFLGKDTDNKYKPDDLIFCNRKCQQTYKRKQRPKSYRKYSPTRAWWG